MHLPKIIDTLYIKIRSGIPVATVQLRRSALGYGTKWLVKEAYFDDGFYYYSLVRFDGDIGCDE